jgi:DNA-binding beta-propeller fold protein YncE
MPDFLISDGYGRISTVVGDEVVATFGSQGSGVNQFRDPMGLAVTPAGGLLVADRGNDRIVSIDDLSGAGWRALGSTGSGDGEFRRPSGASVDAGGRIWIADSGNRRVVRIDDIDGTGWQAFGVAGLPTPTDPAVGAFRDPTGIHVTAAGPVLVADPGASRIVRIDDIDGSGWTTTPFGALLSPCSVTANGTDIVVADFGNRKVAVLDPNLTVKRASTDTKLNGPASVRLVDGLILALVPPFRTVVTLSDTGTALQVTGELRLGLIEIERPLALERLR